MAHALSLSSPSCFYHHHHHHNKAPLSIFSPSLHRPNTTKTLTAIPQLISTAATDDPTALALIGGSSVAALATIISLTDPERRRRQQAEQIGGDDKEVVREYFNNNGFQRWKKIYGESTEDVNRVQLDIRTGHAKTVENVINLLKNDKSSLKGVTVCDAGCGTGSLTIPLAMEGAVVLASDISAAMVDEARRKAEEQLLVGHNGNSSSPVMPKFEVKDLESLDGKYDTVVCLDVLIHYPQNKADGMIAHLASLAENRLILSFAPKTIYYNVLKRVGELFPGPSKATRAYLHAEADVERALQKVGWKIRNRDLVTTNFYFSRMVEAIPDRG